MNDRDALIAGILAEPEADLPRLVYADWLDEHAEPKEPERAEFIRLQIETQNIQYVGRHLDDRYADPAWRVRELQLFNSPIAKSWFPEIEFSHLRCRWRDQDEDLVPELIVRRGFIQYVYGFDWWAFNRECDRCHGSGYVEFVDRIASDYECSKCNGTGELSGNLPGLLKSQPVQHFVCKDKHPEQPSFGGHSYWVSSANDTHADFPQSCVVPARIFERLKNKESDGLARYSLRTKANLDLSSAILELARAES